MPKMTRKQNERGEARTLGGERRGPVGTESPDVVTEWLCIEVKHRAALPRWLSDAVNKIRWLAYSRHLGIVVLHGAGRRDSLVVMSLADFRAWFGDVEPVGDVPANGSEGWAGTFKPSV